MRWISLSVLVVTLALGRTVPAQECCEAKLKATAEKISGLLKSWKTASAKLADICPEEQAELENELAATAKICPIGSRLGETLAFVSDNLTAAAKADAVLSKCCPAGCSAECKGEKGDTVEAKACCAAPAKVAHSKLLRDLQALASYAAGVAKGNVKECCAAKEAKKDAVAKTAKTDSAATKSSCCLESLAAKAESLKKSWKKAQSEYASLAPESRRVLAAKVGRLMERCDRSRLLPPTVEALHEGVTALAAINDHLKKEAEKNPNLLKSAPKEAKEAFTIQAGLIHQTHEVLQRVGATLGEAKKDQKKA